MPRDTLIVNEIFHLIGTLSQNRDYGLKTHISLYATTGHVGSRQPTGATQTPPRTIKVAAFGAPIGAPRAEGPFTRRG